MSSLKDKHQELDNERLKEELKKVNNLSDKEEEKVAKNKVKDKKKKSNE